MRKFLISFLFLSLIFALVACGGEEESSDAEGSSESQGGEASVSVDASLNVAYPTNLQTLDPHLTTNQSTRDVSRQIYEQLLTLNENYEVVPSLAESYEVSEDGLVYTFHLREGVTFHNGEEMQAEDVVASMEKWMETSTQGKANLTGAEFVEVDPYTVELHIDQASLIIPYVLADTAPFPAIVPKESVESAVETGLTEYIGTGPFQLEEWNVDQYIHLTRFDEYQSREEESSGLAGKKEALVKDIYFRIVTDPSTRVAGVSTGEYDIAMDIPLDSAEQLSSSAGVDPVYSDGGISTYVFNNKAGAFADAALRQAFNTALNAQEAMTAAYTNEEFFKLDSGLALPSQVNWHSEAGRENYNQGDIEKAKQLVEESSYSGEELTILTTKDYQDHYNLAVVAQQVLEAIGVKAKLDVYDWPTFQEIRTEPTNYDMFAMTFAVRPTLHQYPFLDSKAEYPGWTDSEEIDHLLDEITEQKNFEDAKPLVDELQQVVWDYLPVAKVGNQQDLVAVSDKVKGYTDLIGPIFWNVSKSE
ncbi:ABC transporter substrate-binding protein [Oceanobacillus halophilus]|uniref:ABC transporter substrate-binding protein n=1 Tax=Oceanobacillus halophilus TaxID=930130 RepID=UPI001F4D8621|nr:ABC transporter substrate-binding protein [Oceanobacillus halophilus]